MTDFSSLGIRPELSRALNDDRITEPTPIQAETIPLVLAGADVIAEAQTGTGKTLAFVLPILQKIDVNNPYIQALIVTPTRELAIQITAEITKMTRFLPDVNVLAVYGGQDVAKQIKRLQGTKQVVVGTPGRVLDHVRRGTIDLSHASMVVLDEADQMLHFGFLQDVETILREVPSTRQTLLFSATMPNQIRTLATRYMTKPKHIRIKSKQITVDAVKQLVVETTDRLKQDSLKRCIDEYRPFLAMIFCRTKRRAKTLSEALQTQGYLADELHGDLSQAQREAVLKRLRSAQIQLLVATDVAARGLDVEGITHVFNYDIPHDVESYIHRIGRTGRAGERGMAITFVAPKDMQHLHMIEKGIAQTIPRTRSTNTGDQRSESAVRGDGQRRSGPSRGGTTRGGATRTRGGTTRGEVTRGEATRAGTTRGGMTRGGTTRDGTTRGGTTRDGTTRGESTRGGTSARRGGRDQRSRSADGTSSGSGRRNRSSSSTRSRRGR